MTWPQIEALAAEAAELVHASVVTVGARDWRRMSAVLREVRAAGEALAGLAWTVGFGAECAHREELRDLASRQVHRARAHALRALGVIGAPEPAQPAPGPDEHMAAASSPAGSE
jgi:hypothetical protein